MTWREIIERVKRGKTTEADGQMLELLRQALLTLDEQYPGDGGYFSALAKVLRIQRQMENNDEALA